MKKKCVLCPNFRCKDFSHNIILERIIQISLKLNVVPGSLWEYVSVMPAWRFSCSRWWLYWWTPPPPGATSSTWFFSDLLRGFGKWALREFVTKGLIRSICSCEPRQKIVIGGGEIIGDYFERKKWLENIKCFWPLPDLLQFCLLTLRHLLPSWLPIWGSPCLGSGGRESNLTSCTLKQLGNVLLVLSTIAVMADM